MRESPFFFRALPCLILLISISFGQIQAQPPIQDLESPNTAGFPLSNPKTAPLGAAEVFRFTLTPSPAENPRELKLHWDIAPEYYLYQDTLEITEVSEKNPLEPETLQTALPKGVSKKDPITEDSLTVYKNELNVTVPIKEDTLKVQVRYQGCSETGMCLPPQTQTWERTPVARGETAFQFWDWIRQIAIFFGFGLLLSLTPCILPMVPILAEILLGQGARPFRKNLILTAVYLLTMALCYAQFGYWAARLGLGMNLTQQPGILLGLIVLILILAFIQLDWLKVNFALTSHLKHYWQRWFKKHHVKWRLPRFKTAPGTILGAMALGGVSAIMISPCVTPALVGSLVYIADSPYPLLASLTLFAMGLGMGLPLAIAACFGSQFLPKTGAWMIRIKKITGWLLIILAVLLSTRLGLFKTHGDHATEVTNITAWHQILKENQAINPKQPQNLVLLDVYADWCFNCQILERNIFGDKEIQDLLKKNHITVVRLDLTDETPEKNALLKTLKLTGPPSLVFFKNGQEVSKGRHIGYLSKEAFETFLKNISKN